MRYHRGRLVDHIHLRVADLAASQRFYAAVLEALNLPAGETGPGFWTADELFISPSDAPDDKTHIHLAFQAADHAMVAAFHRAALAAGGTDNGGPGERSYHPGYYAAFVLDPDGNNIEAVYHGPATRSAPSVTLDAP